MLPHSSRSTFLLEINLEASFRSSAAVAKISSFVGIGGAKGVGNHARESDTRVFDVLVTRIWKHPLCSIAGPM